MTDLHPSLGAEGRFSLNWSYLSAIANGVSAIDLDGMALRNLEDARQFVRETASTWTSRPPPRCCAAPTARRSISSSRLFSNLARKR